MQVLRTLLNRDSVRTDPFGRRMLLYVVVLAGGAAGLVAGLVAAGYPFHPLWAIAALAIAAAIAERGRVQLERGVQMESSISNLPVLFAAVVFGPLPALVCGAASMLGAVRRPYTKVAT